MNLLDALLAVVAPHECVGCGFEGKLLCKECSTGLSAAPRARLKSGGWMFARTAYKGYAKSLVWKLKSGSARAAAEEIASLLPRLDCDVIVPVPTATSRVRQRGYDQAVLIARAYARRHGLPYCKHLVRQSQTRQVGAARAQRLKQLSGAFRVVNGLSLANKRVLIIDDVLTTGATLEVAARMLKLAGAKTVDAVVFAAV